MIRLTDVQEVPLSLEALSAAGNPTTVQNQVFASSDETVLVIVTEPDGTVLARTTGKLGSAQIQVTVDADLGEGVRELTGSETVEVVAGEAAVVRVTAGEPQQRPL
jgi:hypothetical protein